MFAGRTDKGDMVLNSTPQAAIFILLALSGMGHGC